MIVKELGAIVLGLTLLVMDPAAAQGRHGGVRPGGVKPDGMGLRGFGHGGSGRQTLPPKSFGPSRRGFKPHHGPRGPGFAPWLQDEASSTARGAGLIWGFAPGRASDSGEGIGASPALAAPPVHPKIIDIVPVDIKPGSFPNRIGWGSGEAVPVAILSTRMFDAGTVDPATVTMDGPAARLKGQLTGRTALEDVNGDGLMDFVVYLTTEALQISETDADVVVEGMTSGGTSFWGRDTVRVTR
jgi:hypothetical protein